jgi:hypothetical protein
MLIGPTGNSSFLRFRGRAIAPLVATLVALLILLAAVPAGAENGDKHYCDGCTPPLSYGGGPVLDTDSATGLTVTPIYWAPSGTPYQIPSAYETIIDGYVVNIAAASGQTTNVYSVDDEYYQETSGAKQYVNYDFKAGKAIIDTDALPASGCKPTSGNTACITDQQIRDELTKLAQKQGLATDVDHFYPVFLAPNVETQDRDGSTSVSSYCGYHRSFGSGTSYIDYADIPYEPEGCTSGQAPNGDATADGAVSTLSHELNEAITDPDDPSFAWNDSSGNEIGDICAQSYGAPLGSTNPKDPGDSEYNQVINGGKYYVQTEFSDLAYGTLGAGKGCVQSEALAQHPASPTGSTISYIFADALPTRLDANGKASLEVFIADTSGYAVSGDPVTFQTYSRTGKGHCGKLSKTRAKTDDNGTVTISYTASSADVACDVAAIEGDGGQSADSVIYQGAAKANAPTIHADFPSSVSAGGAPATFTVAINNPSDEPLSNAQVNFSFFQGDSPGTVKASQVHLSYSTTGATGQFTPIDLMGDTASGNSITGYEGPLEGSMVPPKSSLTFTLRLSVDGNVPTETANKPLLAIEAYLQQIDSASGTGTVLDDTYASDLHVTH